MPMLKSVIEAFALQMEEGQGDGALLPRRHHARPVAGEEVVEIGSEFDEVGLDPSLGEEVEDGEEQERLVRGLVSGRGGPDAAWGAVEVGEGFEVVINDRHVGVPFKVPFLVLE